MISPEEYAECEEEFSSNLDAFYWAHLHQAVDAITRFDRETYLFILKDLDNSNRQDFVHEERQDFIRACRMFGYETARLKSRPWTDPDFWIQIQEAIDTGNLAETARIIYAEAVFAGCVPRLAWEDFEALEQIAEESNESRERCEDLRAKLWPEEDSHEVCETDLAKLRKSPEELVDDARDELASISDEVARIESILEGTSSELEKVVIREVLREVCQMKYQAELTLQRATRASYGEG